MIGTSWSKAKERISERDDHGTFQKLVATHTSTVLAENRKSCAFSEVLLGLELCQSVTCGGALFSKTSKSYVICEAQNPKSKRFYQQLEPTTKQNHTVTRSVARSGKLEESENMQTRNHN